MYFNHIPTRELLLSLTGIVLAFIRLLWILSSSC